MSTATLPATNGHSIGLSSWLSRNDVRERISSALGGSISCDHFLSQMIIALEKTPEVKACTPQSKFEATNICATLGLLPTHGQVALIPRNIKGVPQVTVMPQWQGYQALMLRHPDVKTVKAVLVHASDTYRYDPETEQLSHNFDPFQEDRKFVDWKDVRGGYLVVQFKDGRPKQYHFVTIDTMQKARSCAQSDNIWRKWFQEQCLKTIYRNAFARRVVPMDHIGGHAEQLNYLEDEAQGNDPNRVPDPIEQKSVSRSEVARRAIQQSQVQNHDQPHDNSDANTETEPEESQDAVSEDEVNRLVDTLKSLEPDMAKRAAIYEQAGCNPKTKLWPRSGVEAVWDVISEINEANKE